MRLGIALAALAAASLAACGGGKQEGVVKFRGSTPNTSVQKAKFVREYETFCPNCGKEVAWGKTTCIDPATNTKRRSCEGVIFEWPKELTCGSCKGTGQCDACAMMDQLANGECYNCRGKGDLIRQGQAKECPNCKGKMVCPICEGSKKCDWCKGAGKVGAEFVKTKIKKTAVEDDLLPEKEKKIDDKKEDKKDDKKTDEKKNDEKKEEKKPEEK